MNMPIASDVRLESPPGTSALEVGLLGKESCLSWVRELTWKETELLGLSQKHSYLNQHSTSKPTPNKNAVRVSTWFITDMKMCASEGIEGTKIRS